MIKTHNKTGLKYLCQSTRADYMTYIGSGKYWRRHLKKHGNNIITEVIGEFEIKEQLSEAGIKYSELYNIVESQEWANLIPESGLCMENEALIIPNMGKNMD